MWRLNRDLKEGAESWGAGGALQAAAAAQQTGRVASSPQTKGQSAVEVRGEKRQPGESRDAL